MPENIQKAHKFSSNNRENLQNSETCGCFYCLSIFIPDEIDEWVDQNEEGIATTALCPYCGVDSILGSACKFPITKEFLNDMKFY
ncbi:MAG: cytoplasmic protein [Promethearchaeota archaeon]